MQQAMDDAEVRGACREKNLFRALFSSQSSGIGTSVRVVLALLQGSSALNLCSSNNRMAGVSRSLPGLPKCRHVTTLDMLSNSVNDTNLHGIPATWISR